MHFLSNTVQLFNGNWAEIYIKNDAQNNLVRFEKLCLLLLKVIFLTSQLNGECFSETLLFQMRFHFSFSLRFTYLCSLKPDTFRIYLWKTVLHKPTVSYGTIQLE